MAESRGTSDSQPEGRSAKGGWAGALLVGSWLCLFFLLAAGASYLFVFPDAGGTRVTIRDTALILPIPPADAVLAAAAEPAAVPPDDRVPSDAMAEPLAPDDAPNEMVPGAATPADPDQPSAEDGQDVAPRDATAAAGTGAQEAETEISGTPADSPESETGGLPDRDPATTLAEVMADVGPEEAAGPEEKPLAATDPAATTDAATPTATGLGGDGPSDSGDSQGAETPTPRTEREQSEPEQSEPEQPGPEQPEPEQTAALPQVPSPTPVLAWQRFGSAFDAPDQRPRIAVVVTGLGLADSATEAAIKLLPANVTLSFTPYARDLQSWIALARAHGHEVMLDLPMEPVTFPADDPGPQALLTTLNDAENGERLDWILGRGSAFVGLVGNMGSRFSTATAPMTAMLKTLKQRGLLYLDNRPVAQSIGAELADRLGVPRAINNRQIDERQASRIAIDARLAQIERIAKTEGAAVALAQPFPVSLERLSKWAREVEARGFVLAPITAVANLQELR